MKPLLEQWIEQNEARKIVFEYYKEHGWFAIAVNEISFNYKEGCGVDVDSALEDLRSHFEDFDLIRNDNLSWYKCLNCGHDKCMGLPVVHFREKVAMPMCLKCDNHNDLSAFEFIRVFSEEEIEKLNKSFEEKKEEVVS